MFLCAVARPIFDDEGNCVFDGKVGCWRVAEQLQRKRSYHGSRVSYSAGDWCVCTLVTHA